ncbi:cytochrome P450 [Mesorhizobium sp. CCNWLW179-1]|uniref:cytochrome P450 n=1 Tax=unclassified Mesorhizobium TaxID=325217 RepID=UPI003014244E
MNDISPVKSTSGCPFYGAGAGFTPYYHEDMFEALAEARRNEPVFYDQDTGYWIISRYDDVLSIMHDHERISAVNTSESATPLHQDALDILKNGKFTAEAIQSNCDGPRHARVRNVSAQLLNIRTFAQLESDIRRLVTEALDALDGKERADLLADFTYELPAQVLFLILGIPKADTHNVKKWAGKRTIMNFSPSTYEQQVDGARHMVNYWRYCVDMVADRMKNPKDDFASNLLKLRNGDDSVITLNELTSVVYGVVFAGHETTTSQLTNAFRALLTERENWEALCADPSLIPNAVEEAFRYCGAVINWRRRAKTEVEIGGVKIPAGGNIMLSFASANRDEKHFENPEKFDIRRKNARKHLTMGNGLHVCLGAPLARLEMKIMLEEFTRRFPDLRLSKGQKIEHAHTYVFRAPRSLPVELQ